MLSMLEFVTTGLLGGVGVGDSTERLYSAFGQPDATSVTRPTILRYRTVQVPVGQGRVAGFFVYLGPDDRRDGDDDWYDLPDPPTPAAIAQALARAGLAYEIDEALTFPDSQETWVIPRSGVRLIFSLDDSDGPLLVKMTR